MELDDTEFDFVNSIEPSLGELEKSSIFKLALDKSSSVMGRLSELLFSVNTPSNTLLSIPMLLSMVAAQNLY